MIYTELTKKAMRIAFDAHKEQTDKTGLPYIFHPFHLAEQMRDEVSVCVALLHDVAEDTAITFEDMMEHGISADVIAALKILTHDDSVPYFDYVQKIKDSGNQTAIAVKLADLRHNSDTSRVDKVDEKMTERWRKYKGAIAMLEDHKTYYFDDDTGAIIRLYWNSKMEIMRPYTSQWAILQPDNSYMREIFIGQGNNCLTKTTEEEVNKVIEQWKKG